MLFSLPLPAECFNKKNFVDGGTLVCHLSEDGSNLDKKNPFTVTPYACSQCSISEWPVFKKFYFFVILDMRIKRGKHMFEKPNVKQELESMKGPI